MATDDQQAARAAEVMTNALSTLKKVRGLPAVGFQPFAAILSQEERDAEVARMQAAIDDGVYSPLETETELLAVETALSEILLPDADFGGGALASIEFGQQPTDADEEVPFSPVVTVLLKDAEGNTIITDNTTQVAIDDALGGDVILGTKVATAVAGICTFTDAAHPTAGVGRTIIAATLPLGPDTKFVESEPFTISAP